MALIKCPECGREISDKAKQCIHCGYPLHTSDNKQSTYKIFLTNCKDKELYASTILYCDLGYSQEEANSLIKTVPTMIACELSKSQAVAIASIFITNGLTISIIDDNEDFMDLDDFIDENSNVSDIIINKEQKNKDIITESITKPKCPVCGSENIEKISMTTKAISSIAFGILSSNVRNTFHCKKCGMKF